MTLVACSAGVAQFKFHLALAQHGRLVGRDEPDAFGELADARRPAVEDAKPPGHDGQLRHAEEIDDADEEKISVGFLADFFAQQRALQIRQNSSGFIFYLW